MNNRLVAAATAGAMAFGVTSAEAAFTSYTTETGFLSALAALPSNPTAIEHNFDSITAPQVINTGDTVDGITFNGATLYDSTGTIDTNIKMAIQSTTTTGVGGYTITGTNFLGTTEAGWDGKFRDGDVVEAVFSIGATYGVGVYFQEEQFVNSDQDNVFQITIGNGDYNAGIVGTEATNLSGFWNAWFLGIVSDVPFTSFTLTSLTRAAGAYDTAPWSADKFISAPAAVPVPATPALMLLGIGALVFGRRSRTRRTL